MDHSCFYGFGLGLGLGLGLGSGLSSWRQVKSSGLSGLGLNPGSGSKTGIVSLVFIVHGATGSASRETLYCLTGCPPVFVATVLFLNSTAAFPIREAFPLA